jgi:RNA polymerase sigma factor (sigma-70 family)
MNTATIETRMSPDEDRALWRRWLGGDAEAGGALSRRLHPVLRSFFASKALAGDVEDLVQQVWLALGETLRRHKDVEITTTVRAYLLGVARHVLFRHIRRRVRGDAIDPIESSIAALEPSLSQIVGRELEAQRMLRALQRLPVDVQTLLELRYVQNLTSAELASLYTIAEGTVKSRLARARRLLKDELKRGGSAP